MGRHFAVDSGVTILLHGVKKSMQSTLRSGALGAQQLTWMSRWFNRSVVFVRDGVLKTLW